MRGLVGSLVVRKDTTSLNPANWLVDWIRGGEPTLSGISVTPEAAMRLAAVWACVRVRSEDVAKVPCLLYRRLPDGGKERAVDHRLFSLINTAPNPRQTAFEFRQFMQAELDLRGNAIAIKEFDLRGNIVALWPIPWQWVQVLVTPDLRDVFYRITWPRGGPIETLPAEAVVHIKGVSIDGVIGLSPIAHHRETIGLALAAAKYGAAFFGNQAQPRGALKVPGVVDKATADALRADWERKYQGVENAHRIAIFDGGMEFVQTGMDNTDAQYIESRKMQNQEIWRIYRVPAHKVGDLERSTYSNIEQQSLEYVSDCLMTEFVRWEQALWRDLLTTQEQTAYFFEFMPDALLRADIKSRYDAYATARNWGWMSVNEIRARENLNSVKNGDVFLQPLNMQEAGAPAPQPQPPELSPQGVKAFTELAALVQARLTDQGRQGEMMHAELSERIDAALRHVSASQKPAHITLSLTQPAINLNMPEQTINVPEREITIEATAPMNGEQVTVTKWTEDGRIKEFVKTPVNLNGSGAHVEGE